MGFSLNLVDFGTERWREINDSVTVETSFTRGEAEELMAKGKKLGIKVRFWSVTQKYTTDDPSKMCPWPFERAYISSDLRVVPCCIIGNPDVSEIGSARENFSGVWYGSTMREFRAAHLRGEIPQVCHSCYDMRKNAEHTPPKRSMSKPPSPSLLASRRLMTKQFDSAALGSDIARSRRQYWHRRIAQNVVGLLGLNRPTHLATEIVQAINPVATIKTKYGPMYCRSGHGRLLWRVEFLLH